MSCSAPPNGKWPASQLVPKRAPLPNGLSLQAFYDPPLPKTPDPLSAPAQLQSSVTPPTQPLRHAEPSPVRAARGRGLGQEGTHIRVSDIVALESWAEQHAQSGLNSAHRTPQGVDSTRTPQLLLSPPDIRTSSNPWSSASSISTPTNNAHTPKPRRSDIGLCALEERLKSLTPERKDQAKFAPSTNLKDPPWHQIRLRPVPDRKTTKSPPRPLEHAVGPRARMTKATTPVTGQSVPSVDVASSAGQSNTIGSDVAARLAQQFSPDVLSEALRLHQGQVKAPDIKPSWPPQSTLATMSQTDPPPTHPSSYIDPSLSSSPTGQNKLWPPLKLSPTSSAGSSRTPSPNRTTRPAASSPKGPRPSRAFHSPRSKLPASVRQLASHFTSAKSVPRGLSQFSTGHDKMTDSRPASGNPTAHPSSTPKPSTSNSSLSSAMAPPPPPLAVPSPTEQGKVSARVRALCSEATFTPLPETPPDGSPTIPATKPGSPRRPPPSALETKREQTPLKQPIFRSPASSTSSPSTSPLRSGARSSKMPNPRQVTFNLPSSPAKSSNDPALSLANAEKPALLSTAQSTTRSPVANPRPGRYASNANSTTDTRVASNKVSPPSPGIHVSSSVLNLVRAVEDGENEFRATTQQASAPFRTGPKSEPRERTTSFAPPSPEHARSSFRPPLRPTQASLDSSTQRSSEPKSVSSPSRQLGVRTTAATATKPAPSAVLPSTRISPPPYSNLGTSKPIRPSWALPTRRELTSSASSQSDGPTPPGASHAQITTKVSALRNVWERT